MRYTRQILLYMRIYVETAFPGSYKELLRHSLQKDQLAFRDEITTEEERLNTLLKADILLGNPKPAYILQEATNLKWVQLLSTGFEYYSNVHTSAIVTNLQDFYSSPCAETVIAGILALYRGMDTCTLLKSRQKWVGHALRVNLQLLYNKKVIILGWGNIGRRVAENLKGFNCDIQVYSRSSGQIRSTDELKQRLPDADIVIGCLPGTEQTKGLFSEEMIYLMKPTAIFCNVGRGNLLQNEQALIDALYQRKLGGAVLDVTFEEPIPADHPLWNCPNTILSQHTGGGYSAEYEGMIQTFLENLEAFKNGRPLQNQVQLSKGY